jgi:hypothetical protein
VAEKVVAGAQRLGTGGKLIEKTRLTADASFGLGAKRGGAGAAKAMKNTEGGGGGKGSNYEKCTAGWGLGTGGKFIEKTRLTADASFGLGAKRGGASATTAL